jgi:hypothetical protein
VVTTTLYEGIARAKRFPSADVVMMQFELAGEVYFQAELPGQKVVEQVYAALKQDVRTRGIPVVILCATEEQKNQASSIWPESLMMMTTATREEWMAGFEKIFASEKAQVDAKARANQVARESAEAFARLDPTNTVLPYLQAITALIQAVAPEVLRDPSIRLPAIVALGREGDET